MGVVTGTESAVGTAVARALAAEGMSLMLIAQPGSQVRALAEELSAAHAIRCFPASLDVADPAAVDRIVMHAEQHVGPIDVLVNTVQGRMTDALLPTMELRGRGHIMNVSAHDQTSVASSTVSVLNLAPAEPGAVAQHVLDALVPDEV